jgi:hypothetical protein
MDGNDFDVDVDLQSRHVSAFRPRAEAIPYFKGDSAYKPVIFEDAKEHGPIV